MKNVGSTSGQINEQFDELVITFFLVLYKEHSCIM
jgi:hypothetical protein